MTAAEAGYIPTHCDCGAELHLQHEHPHVPPALDYAPVKPIVLGYLNCGHGCATYILDRPQEAL